MTQSPVYQGNYITVQFMQFLTGCKFELLNRNLVKFILSTKLSCKFLQICQEWLNFKAYQVNWKHFPLRGG